MIFPDVLTIMAVDGETGAAVQNIALCLRLNAREKNDYVVGPVVTESGGYVKFSREACEREIAAAQKMFVMDYSGDLSSCGPVAYIQLLPPENLEKMILQYEQVPEFWGIGLSDPDTLFAKLKNVSNDLYQPAELAVRSSEILKNPEAVIVLQKRTS